MNMKVGERIKKRRLELGISVDELATIIRKDRATIYRYESSEIEGMPIPIIAPLANALKVSPAYLMGWEDEQNYLHLSDLSENEQKIISIYRNLNESGQEQLMEQVDNLSKLDKYKKCPTSQQDVG